MNKEFHKELLHHIQWMKYYKTISQEDTNLILVTDSIEEAVAFIRDHSIARYGLVPEKKHTPKRWLLEKA